ncbi:DNA binding domain, excisionase family [Thiorhodovibrio winogradskyi]|uniref:DNA binding domain, excisionase family n=1 Tax=Thiorhodovibrio winogradskyi TaxID=77007 RepID=A0ABZ0S8L9_9GAMM|nr:helix-turn-helix domain-containing protein [Thiorhodovibrio winogradskyi]
MSSTIIRPRGYRAPAPAPAETPPTALEPASTVTEFAARYRLHRSTVYALAKRGELRLTRLGGRATRILASDERAWLQTRRAAS